MTSYRTIYVRSELLNKQELVIHRKKNGKLVREAIENLLKNDICFDLTMPPMTVPSGFSDATSLCNDGLKYLETQPHEALSVSINASSDEIRSAYKKMALKYHPDRNPKTNELFLIMKSAHDRLLEKAPASNKKETGSETSSIRKGSEFQAKPSPRHQPSSTTSNSQTRPTPRSKASATNKPIPSRFHSPTSETENSFYPRKPSVPPPSSGVTFDHHRRQRFEEQRKTSTVTPGIKEERKPAPYSFKAPPDVRTSQPSVSSSTSTKVSYEEAMKVNFDKTNMTKVFSEELFRQASFRAYDRIQQKLNARQSVHSSQPEPTPTADHLSNVPSTASLSSPKNVGIPLIPGPCNVQVLAVEATVVEISWQKPVSLASSSAVCNMTYAIELNWRLCSSSTEVSIWESSNKLVTGDRCRKRNLQPGSRYEFRIRAVMQLPYENSGDTRATSNRNVMKSEWTKPLAVLTPITARASPTPCAKKNTAYSSTRSKIQSPNIKESPKRMVTPLKQPSPKPPCILSFSHKVSVVPSALNESTDSSGTSSTAALTVDEIDSVNPSETPSSDNIATKTEIKSNRTSPLKSSFSRNSSSFSRKAWSTEENKNVESAKFSKSNRTISNRKSPLVNVDGLHVDKYVDEDDGSDSGDDEVKEESNLSSESEEDDIDPNDRWYTLIPPQLSSLSPRMCQASYRRNSKIRQTSSTQSIMSLNCESNYQHIVRAEPIPNANVIGYLTLGKKIQVRAECGLWFKVKIHKQHIVNSSKESKKEFTRSDGWGWCLTEESGIHRYFELYLDEPAEHKSCQSPSLERPQTLTSSLSPNRANGVLASFSPRKSSLQSRHSSRPVSSQQLNIPTIHESESEFEVHTWYEKKDTESGYYYYYNVNTNESKWEAPEWVEEFDEKNQACYYVQLDTETAQPLHSTWSKPEYFSRLIRDSS